MHYTEELLARARRVKLLLLDADGVLTDGRVILGPEGMELKAFNSQDGFGLKRLGENGVACGVITGRGSAALRQRAKELGFRHLVENTEDKLPAFETILKQEGLTAEDYLAVPAEELKEGMTCVEYDENAFENNNNSPAPVFIPEGAVVGTVAPVVYGTFEE